MSSSPIFRKNLEALRAKRSGLAGVIEEAIAEFGIPTTSALDAPDAEFLSESLAHVAGEKVWLSELPNKDFLRAVLDGGAKSVFWVLEDWRKLASFMRRHDISAELSAEILDIVAIATESAPEVSSFFAGCQSIVDQEYKFLPGTKSWQKRLSGEFTSEDDLLFYLSAERAMPSKFRGGPLSMLRKLRNSYRRRETLDQLESPRVLTFVGNQTQVLQAISQRYLRGFEALGCEVRLIEEGIEDANQLARLEAISYFNPDFLFIPVVWSSVIFPQLQHFLKIPCVTLLNNPMLTLHNRFLSENSAPGTTDLLYSWDRESADWTEEALGDGQSIRVQSIATTYDSYDQLPLSPSEIEPVIAFIGSVSEEIDGEISALPQRDWELLEKLFWKHCRRDGTGDLSAFIADAEALLKRKWKTHAQHVWATVNRLSILEALSGLPLAVYGNKNWPEVLKRRKIKAEYRGYLEQSEELPHVMSRMQINLNICTAHTSAANMRTYDATGLGTCVLQDANPEAVAYFVEDEEMVFFTSKMSARRKAEALLADPARCREIGAAAHKKVLEAHTYTARAKRFLDDLQNDLKGQKASVDLSLLGL